MSRCLMYCLVCLCIISITECLYGNQLTNHQNHDGEGAKVNPATNSKADFSKWINDLTAESFQVREQATQKLMSADKQVVKSITNYLTTEDVEYNGQRRLFRCLKQIARRPAQPDQRAVIEGLKTIMTSDRKQVAQEAFNSLFQIWKGKSQSNHLAARTMIQAIVTQEKGQTSWRSRRLFQVLPSLKKLVQNLTQDSLASALKKISTMTQIRAGQLKTDADLALVVLMPQLVSLDLEGSHITDAGLKHLQSLTQLQSLSLEYTKITKHGLCSLQGLTGLKELNLSYNEINNEDLVLLNKFTNLESLDLSYTKITDQGLAHLNELKNIKQLYLRSIPFSTKGLLKLKPLKHLEKIHISNSPLISGIGFESITAAERGFATFQTSITQRGHQNLQQTMPQCKLIQESQEVNQTNLLKKLN